MASLPIVAIIAAYNEEDIIGQVVADFAAQGVSVFLIDHASTDGTVDAVEPWRGRGLLGIERFPPDGGDPRDAERYPWADILRRKEALARELDAAWLIANDADEFRESPWAELTLAEAIARVDRAGYNAIDSARFDFWPVDDAYRPGDDVRQRLRFWEEPPAHDRVQIRCWKKQRGPVDLVSSGGHEAIFPGRKVFPLRFVLRHYPIRSQDHGERKVFRERRPRFIPEERARGWHIQYDRLAGRGSFLRDPKTLTPWDPEAVRVALMLGHRGVEDLERTLEAERDAHRIELERYAADLEETTKRLAATYASRSWRWTAPLRAAWRTLTGRPT